MNHFLGALQPFFGPFQTLFEILTNCVTAAEGGLLMSNLFFFFTDGQMYRGEREASAAMNSASPYDFYGKPFYGKTTTDVIVQEGSHAFFHCLVHNLGNQTVSNHAN